jgi:histidine triad (HIT) family protein
MSSIFTDIIARNIPAHIIAEDDQHIAFLDIAPLAKGHTLVVPKKEENYIFDLRNPELQELVTFAQHVAKKIEKAIPCKRIGIAVMGLDIPHAHIHLVPLNNEEDLNFTKERMAPSDASLAEVAEAILGAQEAL